MSPVLEPVADLRRREPCSFGQLPLLPRAGVWVVRVPLPQHRARLLLEAVTCLLAVPDGARQRELPPYAVLADGPERPAAQLLRLQVVRLQPQRLQLRVVVRRESVALEDLIQLLEVSAVEGDDGLRLQHALVLVQVLAGGQRPQEAGESFDVAAVLQHFAHARHLLLRESERRQDGSRAGPAARGRARGAGARRRRQLLVQHGRGV